MNALRDLWDRRSPGERRVLAWGMALLVLALAAALAWLPLERNRARLQGEIPALRASVATLERDAQEVQRLRAMPPVTRQAAGPLASLATDGGGLAGATITVLDAKRVRVVGNDVGFGALLEWLRNAQASQGMQVDTARIEALPARGRVRVELVLAKA